MYEALRAVTGLRFGRTEARETEPIKPVPWTWVERVLSAVSGSSIAAMIWLQWLTGMRPCEAVIMRACDIDMSGEVWLYEPADHKNRWRGHRRIVALGPKAQEVIKRFLQLATQAYLFSPKWLRLGGTTSVARSVSPDDAFPAGAPAEKDCRTAEA